MEVFSKTFTGRNVRMIWTRWAGGQAGKTAGTLGQNEGLVFAFLG